MRSYITDKNNEGVRLDKFVLSVCKSLPGSMVYKYIRKKRIKVNGKKQEASYRLISGDKVELYINDEFFEKQNEDTAFLSARATPDIIYEDSNIMIVNKPAGLVVHTDDGGEIVNTLISYIKKYLYDKGEYKLSDNFVPSLCNRIDRNTCGLVIAAKNAAALRVMNQKIKDREIKKFYYCVVKGIPEPEEAVKKAYIVKDEEKKEVKVYGTPRDGAKTALTKYKVLKKGSVSSLVEVELLTGRTHQIRAHFAYMGHPLAGDGKYGEREFNRIMGRKYQALCAYKLKFDFTTDGGVLEYLNGKTVAIPEEEAERLIT